MIVFRDRHNRQERGNLPEEGIHRIRINAVDRCIDRVRHHIFRGVLQVQVGWVVIIVLDGRGW